MIIVNRLHHELLISYYKDLYDKLPHGHPGTHRGRPVLYITYIPNEPSVTSKNKRILLIDSQQGKIYQELLKEATSVELKIKELEASWNYNYKGKPRQFDYPLKKRRRTILTKELYINSAPDQNTIPNDRDILYNGHYLRSKNELIVCEALNNLGYEFKTEISITTDDFKTFDPDVTYYIPEIEKPVSMEIDGALDKDGYFAKSNERKSKYLSSGFDEFRDVVFFRIYDPYSFDYDRLEAIIKATILVNLDDIII